MLGKSGVSMPNRLKGERVLGFDPVEDFRVHLIGRISKTGISAAELARRAGAVDPTCTAYFPAKMPHRWSSPLGLQPPPA